MLNIIVAVGENNEIGGKNGLLWRLSSDLKRFKDITMGHPMIMGRKTFESIGRVLPGRTSIVVSKQAGRQVSGSVPDLIWASSLYEALEAAKAIDDEVFVIGGGQIYEQALPAADRVYLTRVHRAFPEADVFFPTLEGFGEFVVMERGEEEGLQWEYGTLDRR